MMKTMAVCQRLNLTMYCRDIRKTVHLGPHSDTTVLYFFWAVLTIHTSLQKFSFCSIPIHIASKEWGSTSIFATYRGYATYLRE